MLSSQQTQRTTTSLPQSTPLAILQQQQQQQLQQQHAEINDNEIARPQVQIPVTSQLPANTTQSQIHQQLMQQQQQLLGGLGLGISKQNNGLPTHNGVEIKVENSSPPKDVNEQFERLKSTAQVRGAVADVTNIQSPETKTSTDPTTKSPPSTSHNGTATTRAAADVAAANAFVSQFAPNSEGQQPSLAAQLSAAMLSSVFSSKQTSSHNNTSTATSSSLTVPTTTNPDAHLLAGTSPFAKFVSLMF